MLIAYLILAIFGLLIALVALPTKIEQAKDEARQSSKTN